MTRSIEFLNELINETQGESYDITKYDFENHLEAVEWLKKCTGRAGRQHESKHYVWHQVIIHKRGVTIAFTAFLKE